MSDADFNSGAPQESAKDPVQPSNSDSGSGAPPIPPVGGGVPKAEAFQLHRVFYRGEGKRVFGIALINSLLSIVTLGIYRFWARTRLRRYFWSHIEFDGDPIEYTGTGLQLFLGFLIVMLILIPLLFGLQYVAGLFPQEAWQQGVIGLVQGLGFLFLIQFAVFRARRYRLRHSRWRGIRANQTGSGMKYALRAFGYLMLSFFTFGITYPLYRVRTQRYLTENTYLGSQAFSFHGSTGPLFKKWLLLWGIAVAGVVLSALSADFEGGSFDGSVSGSYSGPLASLPGVGLLPFLSMIAVLLLFVWYRAREFRYFAEVTRFGSLRFASELKARSVVGIYAVYYLVVGAVAAAFFFLIFGAAAGFQEGLAASLEGTPQEQYQQIQLVSIALGLVALLLALAVVSALQPVLVGHPMLKRVVESLKFRGRYDMEDLLQGAKLKEGRGEGLADALDVDVAGF